MIDYTKVPDALKQRAIEKYRDHMVDYRWYDESFTRMQDTLKHIGLEHASVEFSLGYCQSDFGRVLAAASLSHMVTAAFQRDHTELDGDDRMTTIVKGIIGDLQPLFAASLIDDVADWMDSISVQFAERTSGFEADWRLDPDEAGIPEHVRAFVSDYRKVREWANQLGDAAYAMLRDEYEDLTSDEAVWEAIVANEWDIPGMDEEDEEVAHA